MNPTGTITPRCTLLLLHRLRLTFGFERLSMQCMWIPSGPDTDVYAASEQFSETFLIDLDGNTLFVASFI